MCDADVLNVSCRAQVKREVTVLRLLAGGPHIVKLIGTCCSNGTTLASKRHIERPGKKLNIYSSVDEDLS